jgi:hypothetical protein
MTEAPTFHARAPAGLTEALERRGATIEFAWRENLRTFGRASSADGELFVRYSDDPADVRRLEHETAIRGIVGDDGALRSPPVLESGEGWLLERAVQAELWSGPDAIDAAVAAAAEIPALELPDARSPALRQSRLHGLVHTVVRAVRAATGPISVRDLRTARAELQTTDLPTVTSHRDFHPKNILVDADGAWVIDWERTGPAPLGLDLMQLWASVADPGDRERLFEHAVDLVGAPRRAELERLRFAVAVAEASGWHAAREAFDRDDVALARLLELLPGLRPRG